MNKSPETVKSPTRRRAQPASTVAREPHADGALQRARYPSTISSTSSSRRARRRPLGGRRPAPHRARARRRLRLQPDHRPPRPRRAPPRAAHRASAGARDVRHRTAPRARPHGADAASATRCAPAGSTRRRISCGRRPRRRTPPSPPRSSSRPGAKTLFIERVRSVGGQPLLLEQVYLPTSRFPGLPAADLERGSLYELLAAKYGVRPVRGQETIEPILPSAREAGLLGQSPPPGPAHRARRVHRRRHAHRILPRHRARRPRQIPGRRERTSPRRASAGSLAGPEEGPAVRPNLSATNARRGHMKAVRIIIAVVLAAGLLEPPAAAAAPRRRRPPTPPARSPAR